MTGAVSVLSDPRECVAGYMKNINVSELQSVYMYLAT